MVKMAKIKLANPEMLSRYYLDHYKVCTSVWWDESEKWKMYINVHKYA